MSTHPFGWLCLLPSLIAIVLAILTRRVVVSMLIGLLAGSFITCRGDLVETMRVTFVVHLWNSLIEPDRLQVFAFTVMMGVMVTVIRHTGGMAGLIAVVARWAHNRRRGQLATWMLGMLVFFDDYANTVLLGTTLQPLCSKLKISKEKLAYVVDSTAAPVAGLAIVSTWIAAEIDFVQSGLDSLTVSPASTTALGLFLQSIPYRFYPIWALIFVMFIAASRRDYGPMLTAERRELQRSHGMTAGTTEEPSSWWNAVIPIAFTVGSVLLFLYGSGRRADPTATTWWQIFGNADSYAALFWGATVGLATAVVLGVWHRRLSRLEFFASCVEGTKLMIPALMILWFASSLSAMTGNDMTAGYALDHENPNYPANAYRLYTGEFLTLLLAGDGGQSSSHLAKWMPTLVFILSAAVSFATGTSWGTMAIVMPMAVPLAHAALAGIDAWGTHPVMLGTVGSVLAGSIFGDHCSPISDTTVLSSQSCGCDHAAHVWTQLPYAVTVGLVSIAIGTIPTGWGVSIHLLIPAGIVTLWILLRLLGSPLPDVGRPPTEPEKTAAS